MTTDPGPGDGGGTALSDRELQRTFRASVTEHPVLSPRQRQADMVRRLRELGWQRTVQRRLRMGGFVRLHRTFTRGDVTYSTSIDMAWLADVIRHFTREIQCPVCHQLRPR